MSPFAVESNWWAIRLWFSFWVTPRQLPATPIAAASLHLVATHFRASSRHRSSSKLTGLELGDPADVSLLSSEVKSKAVVAGNMALEGSQVLRNGLGSHRILLLVPDFILSSRKGLRLMTVVPQELLSPGHDIGEHCSIFWACRRLDSRTSSVSSVSWSWMRATWSLRLANWLFNSCTSELFEVVWSGAMLGLYGWWKQNQKVNIVHRSASLS